MSHDAASAAEAPGAPGESGRTHRLLRVGAWIAGVAVAIAILDLLGVDVTGWLGDLWGQIKSVPPGYIVAAVVAQSGQTVLAGVSYYGILKAAYRDEVTVRAGRDRLRGRRRDERLPAGEHRHVRDAAHVRGDHPERDVRRRDRGVPRAEDLLHADRDGRLPLPLPLRPGLVRHQPGEHLRASGRDDRDRGRRRLPARDRGPHLLAPGQEALAAGEGRAA